MPVLRSRVAILETICVALEFAGIHNKLRALLLQVGLSDYDVAVGPAGSTYLKYRKRYACAF